MFTYMRIRFRIRARLQGGIKTFRDYFDSTQTDGSTGMGVLWGWAATVIVRVLRGVVLSTSCAFSFGRFCDHVLGHICDFIMYCHWHRKRGEGARGACATPHIFYWGGGQWYVCAPPPPPPPHTHTHTLTNNYLAFFIYQLIILWTISINWHRWLLVNNHISIYRLYWFLFEGT